MKMSRIFLLLACCLLAACGGDKKGNAQGEGRDMAFEYAENISVRAYPKYKVVELKNPWKEGKVLHTYILVDRADSASCGKLPSGTVVYVPLRRAAVFVSPHVSLLSMLGAEGSVAGVADLEFMQLPSIHAKVRSGVIADCGSSVSPDMERIIDTSPDALFLSPFENSGGYGKLDNAGIPIVECADYMETSALGRAEWMRFYGLLFGRERAADSLFAVVKSSYKALAAKARTSKVKRSIITERLTGSTWYVPGGRSSAGRLIADACGRYAFASDSHSGSLALPFETVLDKAGDADVWVFNHGGTSAPTYSSLLAEYRGYSSMKAFREHGAWYVNPMKVPYFEEISFRPDYLLRDYIILLHPDLSLGKLRYFNKVADD